MQRLRVLLEPSEFDALQQLSEREVRPVLDQARVIIRDKLIEEGLLKEPSVRAGRWRAAQWLRKKDRPFPCLAAGGTAGLVGPPKTRAAAMMRPRSTQRQASVRASVDGLRFCHP